MYKYILLKIKSPLSDLDVDFQSFTQQFMLPLNCCNLDYYMLATEFLGHVLSTLQKHLLVKQSSEDINRALFYSLPLLVHVHRASASYTSVLHSMLKPIQVIPLIGQGSQAQGCHSMSEWRSKDWTGRWTDLPTGMGKGQK